MASITLSRSSPVAAHTNGHLSSRSRNSSESSEMDCEGDTIMSDAHGPSAHHSTSSHSQHEQNDRPSYPFGMDGASDLSETLHKDGSAPADSEAATPASLQSHDAPDDQLASHGSRRASKRKTSIEDDEHIANNPELYGLRRSVCSISHGDYMSWLTSNQGRARPTRRLVSLAHLRSGFVH